MSKYATGKWYWNDALTCLYNEDNEEIIKTVDDWFCTQPLMEEARLIAAAPGLLEACKEALDQLETWNHESEPTFTMKRIEQAIQKAEGGEV